MSDALDSRQLTAPRLSFEPDVGAAVRAALPGQSSPPGLWRAPPGTGAVAR
jgi:hypothetical protein